jgi:hypothetical protein
MRAASLSAQAKLPRPRPERQVGIARPRPEKLPPMRPRSTTLVSAPAPPARGSLPPPKLAQNEVDAEVVLPLSRRRPTAPPPASERTPISGMHPVARVADIRAAAATRAAAALAAGFDATAVIVHVYDGAFDEVRVVGVYGEDTDVLVGEVEAREDDFVASTVITNGGPMTMLLGGGLPRVAPRRLAILGARRSLVAVPVLRDGVCIGLIEVVDVEASVTARVAKVAAVVAESLAPSL